MLNLSVYASRLVSSREDFTSGHRGCIGCGEALALRHVIKALGKDIILVNATGCMEIIASAFPTSAWKIPWIHTLFENASAVASGVETAIKVMKRKGIYPKDQRVKVVAIGGDGATADIGLQSLSGALERGHDFLYVCFDNEAYMNTGIQRSSETPFGASTTTSPAGSHSIGQVTWKKDMAGIAAAHNIPYVATASPAYPFDLIEKVKKAKAIHGPSYIHVYSPCPTGWRCPPNLSVKLGRMVVENGLFPLYEVENGKYKLSIDFDKLTPINEYLRLQGRFKHLSEDNIKYIQETADSKWKALKKKCGK